jgi:hypothetical protein
MANSAGICTSFKVELMTGHHALGTTVTRGGTGADALKMALYLTTATVTPATTVFSATNEVSSANYRSGGASVTNATAPTSSGTTAFWTPSASVSWSSVTFTTDCAFLYNDTQGDRAIAVFTFSSQTVTAGTFTLTMPTNDASNALIRIA